jgi:predicted phosphoribosyltransferase
MTDNLYHEPGLRNTSRIFQDRFEAGDRLAAVLREHYGRLEEAIVLAIPSGGVPIGLRVAKGLGCPLDLVIVRKIQIPGNTEAGFGAMSQDGEVFLNEGLVRQLGLSQEQIEAQKREVEQELAVRNRELRGGRAFTDLSGKTVFLADDGLASGFTMLASIHLVRQKGAKEIVVAVPTAPLRSIDMVAPLADRVYSLHVQDKGPFAVANAYRNWYDLTRDEVKQLLQQGS